jgi:hypothetical protein
MKKIVILIALILVPAILLAGALSQDEIKIMKDRIIAKDPERDLLITKLVKDSNGAEVDFALSYLQNDSDPKVRAAVAELMAIFGSDSKVIPILINSSKDKEWFVRSKVARALLLRNQEKQAVSIYLDLIRQGETYWEIYDEVKSVRDIDVKDSLKKELEKIVNNPETKITIQAYGISFLSYVSNEYVTENQKNIILSALISIENTTNRKEIPLISRIIRSITPDSNIKKEYIIEIANLAKESKYKNIRDAGISRDLLLLK